MNSARLMPVRNCLTLAVGLLISIAPVKAQANSAAPVFEVATIKPVESNRSHPHDLNVYPGGRILMRGYSLRLLIVTAYKLSSWQLAGGGSLDERRPPTTLRQFRRQIQRHRLMTFGTHGG